MLAKIAAQKELEVKQLKGNLDLSKIKPRSEVVDPFVVFKKNPGYLSVIAEVKKASPSKGVLCEDFDPLRLGRIYAGNGAAVISVITDYKFFQGSSGYLQALKEAVDIPILRKDFIIDEIQLYETAMLGADFVLLIAAMHDYSNLLVFSQKCQELNLVPLVEVHNREELKKSLDLPVQCIGVNNRNLNTFQVDICTSLELVEHIPTGFIKVSESGIKTPEDMNLLAHHGFDAVLIGETLVSAPDPVTKLKELLKYEFC